MKTHVTLFFFSLILLYGALRLISDLAGYADLWVDEGWSEAATQGWTLIEVTQMVAEDVHPPLYFYMLYVWRLFSGDSVFALRYLAVLITFVSTAIIYRMGTALFTRRAGLLAAALYVLHDLVWVLGREIRQYNLLQLLAALTIYTYWRFWQKSDPRRGWEFVLSGALLLWTNYWGGFVLLALLLHTLFTLHQRLRVYLLAYAAIGLAFLPWVPVLVIQVTQGVPHGIGHAQPASSLGHSVVAFQLLGRPELFWLMLVSIGSLRLTNSMFSQRSRWLPSAASLLPLLVTVLPVVISIVINLHYPSLSFRVLSVVIPSILVLVSHSITSLPAYIWQLAAATTVLLSFSLTAAQPPLRLAWQPIANYVTVNSNDADVVLVETWFDTYAYAYYLDAVKMPYIATELHRREQSEISFTDYLSQSLEDYDGIWVTRFSTNIDLKDDLTGMGFTLTGQLNWQTNLLPIEIVRYDRIENQVVLASFDGQLQLLDYAVKMTPDALGVTLLWVAEVPMDKDYVISVFLLDQNGVLVTQHDAPPLNNTAPTSGWVPGQVTFDTHALPIEALTSGRYRLGLRVYRFTDNTFTETRILPPDDCDVPCDFVILDTVKLAGE